MKKNEIKNYVIGFLVGFCMVFLFGATTWFVDGHCQSSLSGVGFNGEVYVAITNTSTGKTIVRKIDLDDYDHKKEITFDAKSINTDQLIFRNGRRQYTKPRE